MVTRTELGEDIDLDRLFVALAKNNAMHDRFFWLDAGSDATTGWSFVGVGEPVERASVLAIELGGNVTEPPLQPGDYLGWESYEAGAAAVGAPVANSTEHSAWMRVTALVALNHSTGAATMLVDRAENSVHQFTAAVTADPMPFGSASARTAAEERRAPAAAPAVSPDAYAAQVEACRAQIELGNAYQLCLTTRFTVTQPRAASEAYRELRRLAPSHHGGFIHIGELAVASASPEQFLDVAAGRVSTSPIKGTRPRSEDVQEDQWLALDLEHDPKERAENTMIVDLMRNDLNRVCTPGSVLAERWLEIETYRTVHQLVSKVAGDLRPGVQFAELLHSTFPAGSMTGAPKLSAMTILHGLEQRPRGIYSGCFGYVTQHGAVDLAMVIRTIVFASDAASVSAGGGITWHSIAHKEVAEVATKAKAPLQAVGAVLPPEWAATLR